MKYIYAPVRITVYNRFDHFKRCIESLARCTGADQTELFIGIDYPKSEADRPGNARIREYADSISGFKAVHLSKRDKNLGQLLNGRDLLSQIRERGFDRFIDLEDDLEFSPGFLEYMNQCLEKYKDDSRVAVVCGYSYPEWEEVGDYPYNAFPLHGFCAWGTGIWMGKMPEYHDFMSAREIVFSPRIVRKLFREKMHVTVHRLMYRYETSPADLRRRCYCVLEGKYCIFPVASKVRNHGFDGSGSHCARIDKYEEQMIDGAASFVLDDFEIREYPQIQELFNKQYSPNWKVRFLVRAEYLLFRITGKCFHDFAPLRSLMQSRL